MAKKIRLPQREYQVRMTGDYAGVELRMRGMSTRDLIRMRSGELADLEALQMAADHVIEHNLDTDDVLELDASFAIALLGAWSDAIREAALPNPTATSSDAP